MLPPMTFKALPISDYLPDKPELDKGGKIVLPELFLMQFVAYLDRRGEELPAVVLFRIRSCAGKKEEEEKFTHCGAIEFTAPDQVCCMPSWMMDHLGVDVLDDVEVTVVTLPSARSVVFKPSSSSFMQFDQKVLLERSLRAFSTLTVGDPIPIEFNNRTYTLLVSKTDPEGAVSLIETNIEVDYLPADDDDVKNEAVPPGKPPQSKQSVGYSAYGNREVLNIPVDAKETDRAAPDLDWQLGTLRFLRPKMKEETDTTAEEQSREPGSDKQEKDGQHEAKDPFPGKGQAIYPK